MFNTKTDQVEYRISELNDKLFEMIKSEKNEEKIMRKSEEHPRDLSSHKLKGGVTCARWWCRSF